MGIYSSNLEGEEKKNSHEMALIFRKDLRISQTFQNATHWSSWTLLSVCPGLTYLGRCPLLLHLFCSLLRELLPAISRQLYLDWKIESYSGGSKRNTTDFQIQTLVPAGVIAFLACPASEYNKSLSLEPLKGRPFQEHLVYWSESLGNVCRWM